MNHPEKQLKYSIRKVSVGAASVVIGAFYFAMGAGVVHAETNATTEGGTSHSSPSPESNTNNPNSLPGSNYQAEPAPNPATLLAGVAHSVKEETETKIVTRTIKYVDASDESKEVATPVTQTVTLTRKKGTEEWTTGKWESKTAPTVDGYDVSGNNTVEAKEVTSTTEDETVLVYYSKKESASSNSSSTSETTPNRSRRVRRNVTDGTTEETSDNSTEITVKKIDPKRKGETLKPDQPGVTAPKQGEEGGDDQHAHLKFKMPDENATVEELWKIIENLPDDFQNNERSYLRNMDTLGEALRFDKTAENPEGVPLQPGEIREISSFGGWTAIMKKDGETGKFAIGMKNKEGYFTGWYTKNGKREEGGMLGSNALDQIYLHEQALDRRFNYMLMLAKGRTIANKEDVAQDGSEFNIKTENRVENKAELDKLPVKEKEDKLQHSPNVEGFNGIEKRFDAFSTAYGSRLKIEFVTGYISDYEGSKGTYRIVVKAIKKDKNDASKEVEETIYDHTINRIDGVVENEERYAQGVDLSAVNKEIKKLLKDEYNKKVTELAKERYKKEHPGTRIPSVKQFSPLKPIIEKELAEKGEAIVELPVDKNKLNEKNFKKETNFIDPFVKYGNALNNVLKSIKDMEVQNTSPIWFNSTEKTSDNPKLEKSKDPDRVYKLLNFILPTAKKIIYHADTDQLELETDPEKVKNHRAELEAKLKAKQAELESADENKKTELNKEISALKSAIGSTNSYTYTEARNGSKEAKILGSLMEATKQPPTTEMKQEDYEKYRTNKLAAEQSDGLPTFTKVFVEKENVTRKDVLPDAELSKRITEEIGGDNEKLGKGGYFSTGDIPLGKDVVAYKIQVFAENEKRVGVNKQSPRLQYNLPILADFSVIQDTVEASKEVAKRIIEKQVKDKKIPPEEGEELKGKIDESKKTSEVRKAISGNVKVKYVDTNGNVLTLNNEVDTQSESVLGEKAEDGTYFDKKDQVVGTDYDVTAKKLDTITTTDGKRYRVRRSVNDGLADGSAEAIGNVSTGERTVTYVYEESTTSSVTTNHYKEGTTEKLADSVIQPDLTKGTEYTTKAVTIPEKIEKEEKEDRFITRKTTYTLVKTPDNANGTVNNSDITVDYYYRENIEETVVAKEETSTESKKITRTIKYVDKVTNAEIHTPETQEVTLTREKTVNKVTGAETYGNWTTASLAKVTSPDIANYTSPSEQEVPAMTVTSETADSTVTVTYEQGTETSTESKKITRTIKYVDKVTNAEIHTPETQEVTLTREKTVNKVTGNVTYTEWSTGTWEEVVSPEIANYGKPDLPKVSNEEVTADSKDTTILVRYDRLSTPDKPIPEKPEIPKPQAPGTPDVLTPEKPNPQPNPEHPSAPTPIPELPNQETPIPELTPEPDTPRPETPVSPDPEVPTYETGKREELPNTGTEANATLASAGIMTLLAGLGLGFFKKKEKDEK